VGLLSAQIFIARGYDIIDHLDEAASLKNPRQSYQLA